MKLRGLPSPPPSQQCACGTNGTLTGQCGDCFQKEAIAAGACPQCLEGHGLTGPCQECLDDYALWTDLLKTTKEPTMPETYTHLTFTVGQRVLTNHGPATVVGFERFNDRGFSIDLSDDDVGDNRVKVELDDLQTQGRYRNGYYALHHDLDRLNKA